MRNRGLGEGRIFMALKSDPRLITIYRAAFDLRTAAAQDIVCRAGFSWEEGGCLIQKLEDLGLIRSIPSILETIASELLDVSSGRCAQCYLTADGYAWAGLTNNPVLKNAEETINKLTRVETKMLDALRADPNLTLIYEASLEYLPMFSGKNGIDLVRFAGLPWSTAVPLLDKLVDLGLLYCLPWARNDQEQWEYKKTTKGEKYAWLLNHLP